MLCPLFLFPIACEQKNKKQKLWNENVTLIPISSLNHQEPQAAMAQVNNTGFESFPDL